MTLSAATLKTELEKMTPNENDETAVIADFSSAFETYFLDALADTIAVATGTLASSTSAMKTALVGMTTASQASTKIQAGIVAFWTSVGTNAATIFVATPAATGATPPVNLTNIKVKLDTAFSDNTDDGLSLSASAQAIADAIHLANAGGVCIFPLPPAGLGLLTIV